MVLFLSECASNVVNKFFLNASEGEKLESGGGRQASDFRGATGMKMRRKTAHFGRSIKKNLLIFFSTLILI